MDLPSPPTEVVKTIEGPGLGVKNTRSSVSVSDVLSFRYLLDIKMEMSGKHLAMDMDMSLEFRG